MKNIRPTHFIHKSSRGFITLISVLIVGVIGASITVSVVLLGLASLRTGFSVAQTYQAKALANACVEEGLRQIRDSTAYTGSGGLSMGQGACTYTVTSQGGQNRTIDASGTVDTTVRKVRVIVNDILPVLTPTSWQEVP